MTAPDALRFAERLLEAPAGDGGFAVLCERLLALCAFRNLIIFRFASGRQPSLVYSNLDRNHIQREMGSYIRGLHVLDPFSRIDAEGQRGLFRMRDIAPESFTSSVYHLHHYQYTDATDVHRVGVFARESWIPAVPSLTEPRMLHRRDAAA